MIAYALRWLCAVLAGFVVLNVVAGVLLPGFDASIWVLDVRWLPRALAVGLVLAACGAVMAGAFWRGARVSQWAAAGTAVLGMFAAVDAARFWMLLGSGDIHSRMPVPASLLYAVVMGAGVAAFLRERGGVERRRRGIALAAVACVASLFPVLQMACFGLTDYSRRADAALVFGARTYADERASDALADRAVAAAGLYKSGLVGKLILSGGPGDGKVDEAEAMKRVAMAWGVPAQDLILDREGVNTRASVTNAAAICRERGFGRVLAVSHFYHLPRIKLEAERAGLDLYTVPAGQRQPLRALPWFVARETAAWWVYWARASCRQT